MSPNYFLVNRQRDFKTDEQATKAVLATTARFSSDAKLLLERNSWVLEGRDYGGVVDWLESVT